MKTPYKQFNSLVRRICKISNLTHEVFFNRIRDKFNNEPYCNDNAFAFWQSKLELMMLEGGGVHIFLKGDKFIEWLIECTPTLGDGMPQVLSQSLGSHALIFHFETSSRFVPFIALVDEMNLVKPDGTSAYKGKRPLSACIQFSDGNKHGLSQYSMPFLPDSERNVYNGDDKKYFEPFRLICGLGMYLSCFPEMLADGPPDDIKHPSHHQYKSIKTIGISPKVREAGDVTPHFRRGHFRVLSSEKFTKKRFQAVFVKHCFVKGEAVTVLNL